MVITDKMMRCSIRIDHIVAEAERVLWVSWNNLCDSRLDVGVVEIELCSLFRRVFYG